MRSLAPFITGRYWKATFLLLLLVFAGVRMTRITADPPSEISSSAALYTDEGFKLYTARNLRYYGDWHWSPSDEYRGWHEESPLPSALYGAWFAAFGVSIAGIRTLYVVISILTMIVLFLFARRFYGIPTAFVSLILMGSSGFLVLSGRMALYENLLVLLLAALLYVVTSLGATLRVLPADDPVPRRRIRVTAHVIAIAVLAGCGLLTKMNILIPAAALAVTFALLGLYSRPRLAGVAVLGGVLLYLSATLTSLPVFFSRAVSAADWIPVSIKNILPFVQSARSLDPPYTVLLKSLSNEFVIMQPVEFFAAAALSLVLLYRGFALRRARLLDVTLAGWFLFGFAILSVMNYHPSRYYLVIALPLVLLAARVIASPGILKDRQEVKPEGLWYRGASKFFSAYFTICLPITLLVIIVPFGVRKRLMHAVYAVFAGKDGVSVLLPYAPVAIGFIAAIIAVIVISPQVRRAVGTAGRFSALLLAAAFLFHLTYLGRYFATAGDNQYEASRRLGEMLPANAVIAGCWSAGLTLENGLRPLVIQESLGYNTALIERIVKRRPVATVTSDGRRRNERGMPLYLAVSSNGAFDRAAREKYARYLTRRNRIGTVELGLYDVEIYRMTPPTPRTGSVAAWEVRTVHAVP